jgi:hypothetical protein
MKGFKGFDSNLKCRDRQYEIGKTVKEPEAKICEKGLHFCEHPLDTLAFYPPGHGSRYAEIGADDVAEERKPDKLVCKNLTVKAELTLSGLVAAAIKFVFDRACWTEYKTSSKDNDGVTAADKSGAASATGYSGAASATGENGFASALGVYGRAKAALGNWITLAEWERDENRDWQVKEVKSAKIDGERLMPDTWYWLKDGNFEVCGEIDE